VNRRAAKWAIALLLSAAVHAGSAIWLGPGEEPVQVAGGAQADIAMLGNAFQDSLAAGAVSETVQPVETEAEAVQPARPVTETTNRPRADTATAPVQAQITSEAPTEPVESASGDIAVAALRPSEAEPQAPRAPAETTIVKPVDEPAPPVTPDVAPRPQPRPEKVAEVDKPPRQPKASEKQVEKPTQHPRQRAGAGGAGNQTARRGSADGERQARKASSGDTGRSREAGNAAVSNYPGKVYAKLRRSLRYPSEARRQRIRGEAHVRFTVSRSGGVGSVRLARSSGSPILDNAALDTVRRAAPFPAIPPEAGRSSWSFTVPLAFTR
jgi:protein TonB